MNTLLEFFQLHTPHTFTDAVRTLRQHAPGSITPRMMQRLELLVLTGEEPGEYEWGKVRAAMEDSAPPATIPRQQTAASEIRLDVPPVASALLSPLHGIAPETKRLHKQHAHYHALLVSATTDAGRAEYATIIMSDIIPALDAYYDTLRSVGDADTADTAAPDFDPIPITGGAVGGVDIIRRLQSLRTRVSKIKKHLLPAAPTLARRAELETELEEKQAEIERIEQQIA